MRADSGGFQRAMEGGLVGGRVCASLCSALGAGPEAIDGALGACIWKQHASKGL